SMAKSPETEHPVKVSGYAARDSSGILSPFNFSRRSTGDRDVQFKVLYCGVCHTDLHMIRNDWGSSHYPIVPGHEIVGVVTEVGSGVEKFNVGDKIGVGFIVGSCRNCDQCDSDLENYCRKQIHTFNRINSDGTITYGGYSNIMVVDEHFGIRWPENFSPAIGAPLLCAGITTYSPLRYYGLDKPGQRIGVVGLGGLGHIAVKFAKAFGAIVTVVSTSSRKKSEAIETLGADEFIVSRDTAQLQAAAGTLDGIIDTVSAPHPLLPLIALLKPHGKMVVVGVPEKPLELHAFPLIAGRKLIGGSNVGGIKETQEMIDFAAKHNILPDVEIIPLDYINTAMDRLDRGDVKYRFVIDVENSFQPE
ncbi:geraniol dehydrogenase 1, partial [Genlisea aurea]